MRALPLPGHSAALLMLVVISKFPAFIIQYKNGIIPGEKAGRQTPAKGVKRWKELIITACLL